MAYIGERNTRKTLELFNRLYAEGKDLSAMLDELACLCRDLMVLKTAGEAGLTMLSGVSSDREAKELAKRFSGGELIRMISQLQQTMAGFTRSASRRMDAELCLMSLCQPELSLDAESLNARLTRLEEQIKSGAFVSAVPAQPAASNEEEYPPIPDDDDAPPEESEVPAFEAPVGFWTELATAIRRELKPPVSGFFASTPSAPVQGVLQGDVVVLRCANEFTMQMVDRPEILALVVRKASAQLGRPMRAKIMDQNAKPENSAKMEQLLNFGRAHSDIIKIKE